MAFWGFSHRRTLLPQLELKWALLVATLLLGTLPQHSLAATLTQLELDTTQSAGTRLLLHSSAPLQMAVQKAHYNHVQISLKPVTTTATIHTNFAQAPNVDHVIVKRLDPQTLQINLYGHRLTHPDIRYAAPTQVFRTQSPPQQHPTPTPPSPAWLLPLHQQATALLNDLNTIGLQNATLWPIALACTFLLLSLAYAAIRWSKHLSHPPLATTPSAPPTPLPTLSPQTSQPPLRFRDWSYTTQPAKPRLLSPSPPTPSAWPTATQQVLQRYRKQANLPSTTSNPQQIAQSIAQALAQHRQNIANGGGELVQSDQDIQTFLHHMAHHMESSGNNHLAAAVQKSLAKRKTVS